MRRSIEDRKVEFRGVLGDVMERQVTLPDGRRYSHRCSRVVFEQVVFYLEDHPRQGATMSIIAEGIDAPYTQVHVALELLRDRGILETHGRRAYVTEGYRQGLHAHAMTEYYALVGGHPPQIRAAGETGKEDEPNQ